jgi:hypothetical protein
MHISVRAALLAGALVFSGAAIRAEPISLSQALAKGTESAFDYIIKLFTTVLQKIMHFFGNDSVDFTSEDTQTSNGGAEPTNTPTSTPSNDGNDKKSMGGAKSNSKNQKCCINPLSSG